MADNNKKQSVAKMAPVHSIRVGTISAAIFHTQSNAGFAYYHYAIFRNWASKSTGKESQGSSFFSNNMADLCAVIRLTTNWLNEKNQSTLAAEEVDAQDAALHEAVQ